MAADTLRERLAKLLAEWREDVRDPAFRPSTRSAVLYCAEQLAAILAESESAEQCNCDGPFSGDHQHWPVPILVDESHPAQTNPGRTHYVGDDCEGGHAEVGEVKPLPLGHPYSTFVNGNGPCTACIPTIVSPPRERPVREAWRCCGQPRSAHEPLPAPAPAPLPKPKL